jgi:hypothetical protein
MALGDLVDPFTHLGGGSTPFSARISGMKVGRPFTLGCLSAMIATGADVGSSFEECLIVYEKSADKVPMEVLGVAEQITGAIFHEIDVAVHWSRDPHQRPKGSCIAVGLQFDEVSKVRSGPDAMGYALPYSKGCLQVYILIQRVLQCRFACLDSGTKMREGALLGHVMAHEIGHVLQGVVRHSEEGVMKTNWTSEEVLRMVTRRLSFTSSDADLIRLSSFVKRKIATPDSYSDAQAPDKR